MITYAERCSALAKLIALLLLLLISLAIFLSGITLVIGALAAGGYWSVPLAIYIVSGLLVAALGFRMAADCASENFKALKRHFVMVVASALPVMVMVLIP